jgi:hypothetical protein
MTHAVCVFCAGSKWGCWTRCGACGKAPFGEDDVAWSLILSDHFVDVDQLKKASEIMLRTGKMPKVDPAGIENAYSTVRSQARSLRKMGLLPPEAENDEPAPAA